MSPLEKIVGLYFDSIWNEARRYAKIQGFIIAVSLIKGIRKGVLYIVSGTLSALVLVTSLVFALIFNVENIHRVGEAGWMVVNGVLLLVMLISGSYTLFFLTERQWIRGFCLEDQILQLERLKGESPKFSVPLWSEEQIKEIVENLLERKIDDSIERRFGSSSGSSVSSASKEKSSPH